MIYRQQAHGIIEHMPVDLHQCADLRVGVAPDGILDLYIGGDISCVNNREALHDWAQKTKETIRKMAAEHGDAAYCIVDITTLRDFDEESVEILKDLASGKDLPVIKTAVIGGTVVSKMALKTIIFMTRRTDLQTFTTREEAVVWLKSL